MQAWVQENASVVEDPEKHSLLTLPYPAVVAGDRFREVYYWDSYFIVRGLIVSGMTQTAMVPLPPHTHKHFHTFTHPSFHLRALVQMPTVGDNFWGL